MQLHSHGNVCCYIVAIYNRKNTFIETLLLMEFIWEVEVKRGSEFLFA
jgi:hypothetical protein